MKVECGRCGAAKSSDAFPRQGRVCKQCKSVATQAWRAANKERAMESVRSWHAANQERVKEYRRRKYRKNAAAIKAAVHAQYVKNPERAKLAAREWAKANAERVRETKRAWARANREVVASYHRNRRAKKYGALGSVTLQQVQARTNYYGGRCYLCGDVATGMDHVKPLACGGSHWPANLRPVCRPCNSKKGGRWPYAPALMRRAAR